MISGADVLLEPLSRGVPSDLVKVSFTPGRVQERACFLGGEFLGSFLGGGVGVEGVAWAVVEEVDEAVVVA